jgi:hypothetical protein
VNSQNFLANFTKARYDKDMKLYYNLVKGIKEKELEKLLKQREDSISKLQKIEAKRLRKSLKESQK